MTRLSELSDEELANLRRDVDFESVVRSYMNPRCTGFCMPGPPMYGAQCRKPADHDGDCEFGTAEENAQKFTDWAHRSFERTGRARLEAARRSNVDLYFDCAFCGVRTKIGDPVHLCDEMPTDLSAFYQGAHVVTSNSVKTYRTKVIEIEISDEITADNRDEIVEWIEAGGGNSRTLPEGYEVALIVFTDSGNHDARYGWRVARGTKGEFYPLDPEVFEAKYEPEPVVPSGTES